LTTEIIEKYDVAISYLAQDEDLAFKIYTEIGQIFKVFIYTQHQNELVGKGGVETLRDIFINRANLIVILYRKGWGQTSWTSTEERAIVDFGLKNQWKGILLVNLDSSKTPDWHPESDIYLDYGKYQFEELIGVIKSRAEERGSEIKTITALEKAKILRIDRELAERRKKFLYSEEGVKEALIEVESLLDEIDRICKEINSSSAKFDHEKRKTNFYYLQGYNPDNTVSPTLEIQVLWSHEYRNSLRNSKLYVTKIYYLRLSKRADDLFYDFDVNPSMQNRWRDNQNGRLLTFKELANEIVKILIDYLSPVA